MGWHQTIVVGNLGKDPELKFLQDGKAVCNFSLAVSEKWKDRASGEDREKTTWYRVAVWGGQAEACNTYLSKGKQALVIGNVSTRAYIDNAGNAAASLDLTATSVQFLGGGSGGQNQGGQSNSGGSNQEPESYDDYPPSTVDDIPF